MGGKEGKKTNQPNKNPNDVHMMGWPDTIVGPSNFDRDKPMAFLLLLL